MRKQNLTDYYKVMFTEYPDVVSVEQLSAMLGGPSSKSIYRLLKSGEIQTIGSESDTGYRRFQSLSI